MSSPKMICKSGYLQSITHFFNIIEYAGNKIDAQSILYLDGTMREISPEKRITLTPLEESKVSGISVTFKDGTSRVIAYQDYITKTSQGQGAIRTDDIVTIETEPGSPHSAAELDFFKYLPYVAERTGVVKEGGYGLFGVTPGSVGNISTQAAKEMGERYESCRKWSHIISLPTHEAKATGYDNRAAWKELIISKAPELAKAYNISLEKLVINCAYHGNTDNPHVHLVMYSTDPTEGFVKGGKEGMKKATETVKSLLSGEIYREQRLILTQEKAQHQEELYQKLGVQLEKMEIPQKLTHEFERLGTFLAALPGKRYYGYLPPELKEKTDQLLRGLFELPEVAPAFEALLAVQRQLIGQYITQEETLNLRLHEFREAFFHPAKGRASYHNQLIRAAIAAAERPSAYHLKGEQLKEKIQQDIDWMGPQVSIPLPPAEGRATEKQIATLRSLCHLLVMQAYYQTIILAAVKQPNFKHQNKRRFHTKSKFKRKSHLGREQSIEY